MATFSTIEGAQNSTDVDIPATGIRVELEYRQVDIVLAVAYGLACFFASYAFVTHWRAPSRQVATLGFYLLLALAAITRTVWFSTPYGVLSVAMKPPLLVMGDDDAWHFLVAEFVELLGSYLIYSIFVLIVVFWADMLRRLFTHESVHSKPLRVFSVILILVCSIQSVGFFIFALGHQDSFWLMLYDDIVLCGLSFASLVAVLVYSFRMKTVLQAFLEVSQIDTTDRIKAVNWATSICALFLILNSLFLCYSIVSLARFHAVGVYVPHAQWWLFVALKHVVELFVLYFLLYALWGKSNEERRQREGYEQINDVLSDEEMPGPNALTSTPHGVK